MKGMTFGKLHISPHEEVIGCAVEVKAECGEVIIIELYGFASEHFLCRHGIEPYTGEEGIGCSDISCH